MKKFILSAVFVMAISNVFAFFSPNYRCVELAAAAVNATDDYRSQEQSAPLNDVDRDAIYNQVYNTCVASGTNAEI
ncbi:hypothetical protein K5I29_09830 [Flavobacterium agricola]|uniref:Uncharacterized protein n=1 Tax=Flavobacterium agricola TaxID=2870839 RepID=A0ABY6M106_9FLAO|nr:hypothetical protein [Flavobacterium agricola]UYW00801.1 hypothetical protein K5I29_09830 [Flavobacterium agricola]